MDSKKEFGDILVEEVLAETADNFLGERKHIEEEIKILSTYVAALKGKTKFLNRKASFLNFLMMEGRYAEKFYQSLGISNIHLMIKKSQLYQEVVPKKLPFAWNLKQKFIKLVLYAYDDLQKACNEYLFGNNEDDLNSQMNEGRGNVVNYRMVMIMGDLINKKIEKLNDDRSPYSVLHFAKSLNPDLLGKEKITGGISPDYENRINTILKIKPVDMDGFSIEKYPELPKLNLIKSHIAAFCGGIYKSNQKDIIRLTEHLKTFISDITSK